MVLKRNTQLSENALVVNSNCTKIWQNAIQERIEAEVVAVISVYETIDVNLFDVSRSSNVSFIAITFDTVIEIRSGVPDVDVNRFIQGPFDSQSEKVDFIQYLVGMPCPEFDNVVALEMILPSELKVDDKEDNSNNDEDQLFLGLFIAVGAGSGAIILAVLTVACLRRKQRRRIDDVHHPSSIISPSNGKEHYHREVTPIEINHSHDGTDISTLGDPIVPETIMKASDKETSTVDSGGDEYDYIRAYVDVRSITESNMRESNSVVSHRYIATTYSDDLHSLSDIVSTTGTVESGSNSFVPETEYSVAAPPGLLGLILVILMVDQL